MARLWESIFLIAATVVCLSGCAPSRAWVNYGPVKANGRFENSAVRKFDNVFSEDQKTSYEVRQGQGVKTLHRVDGSSPLLTKPNNTLYYPTPFAPVKPTVEISRASPSSSTFARVISQTNATQQPLPSRNVPTKTPNRVNPTGWTTIERTSSTSSPASRRGFSVIPLPIHPKQVLQKPLATNARKEISNTWIPLKTTSRPISHPGTKTNPTTAFPVPTRTRVTPKPSFGIPSGSGKGSQATGSLNKPGNSNTSSLIAPSSVIVVPPLVTSCPDGQKEDDIGICREEFR